MEARNSVEETRRSEFPTLVVPPVGRVVDDRSQQLNMSNVNKECVWRVDAEQEEGKDRSVTFYEGKGNAFHLSAVIRRYTAARIQVVRDRASLRGSQQLVKIEVSKLYDALGLLRSLQYDVAEFNSVVTKEIPDALAKYKCFRLARQAAAFGVRMPPVGTKVEVAGLDSLIQFIEEEKKDLIETARANIEAGIVDFDSLQEFFTPGRDLIDHGVGTGFLTPTLMRSRACFYSRGKSLSGIVSTFYVGMEVAVSTGDSKFAIVETQFPQSQFNGTRSVTSSMDMFTIPSHKMIHELSSRGRVYQSLCDPGEKGHIGTGVMVEYRAGTFIPTAKGSLNRSSSSRSGSYGQASRSRGRMIVDTIAAWQRGVHCANTTGVASDAVVSSLKLHAQKRAQHAAKQQNEIYNTGVQTSTDADDMNDVLILKSPLPDSLLCLSWPVVPGFSLQARCWGVAMVHGTQNVQFNSSAFDSLVMPASRKRLIQALITSHGSMKSADLIAGKGEGSIFLLHGPPGVGKTLTAEGKSCIG